MRPDRGGAEELPIHAQGRILLVGADRPCNRSSCERFAEVCQYLPDRPRFGDDGDEPDGTATRWARTRKLLPHPCHQFRPGDPRGVVRLACDDAANAHDSNYMTFHRFKDSRGMRASE